MNSFRAKVRAQAQEWYPAQITWYATPYAGTCSGKKRRENLDGNGAGFIGEYDVTFRIERALFLAGVPVAGDVFEWEGDRYRVEEVSDQNNSLVLVFRCKGMNQ